MNESDKKAFAEALVATGEIYDRKISPALAKMYFQDLGDYPLVSILTAFAEHRKDPESGAFFPKPGDIIKKLTMSKQDSAVDAWGEVLNLARNWRAAKHNNPAAEAAVRAIGGWQRIGLSDRDQIGYLRNEFIAAFGAGVARQEYEHLAAPDEIRKFAAQIGATSLITNHKEQ